MSDDIIKYLRLSQTRFNRNAEAANEIELLRSDLASCQHDLNYWYERCTRAEACAKIMHNQINKKWWKR
jgi:hypothetical protein